MKIALSYSGNTVFTNFRKRKICKNSKKYSKRLTFKLILFFLSITTFHCFSITNSEIRNMDLFDLYSLDTLKISKPGNSLKSQLDTDKDGVLDILDLDDDNDGILDHDEGFRNLNSIRNKGIIVTMNGAWVLVYTSVYFELPSDLSHGDEFWIPFMGSKYVKAVKIKFENSENGIKFTQTAAKHTIGNDPDLDTNLNYDFENGGIVAPIATSDTDQGYGVASIVYNDIEIISNYLGEIGQEWLSQELDTDNDGLINSRDTDSDNDGCPDAYEGENNIVVTATLHNGSNGGSSDNLGIISNINGIPLPLGTIDGLETSGQNNSNKSINSEQLIVSSISDMDVKTGDDVNITINASAMKTATFNLGTPNYSEVYATDVSALIEYKWYREDNVNSVLSTSATLEINDIQIENSGNYIVEVKGSNNTCVITEYFALKVDNVLKVVEPLNSIENKYLAFPNPSKGDLNIALSSKVNTEAKIILYDITGKEVFSTYKNISTGKNDFNFMIRVNPGIFYLKILNNKIDFGITKIVFQ